MKSKGDVDLGVGRRGLFMEKKEGPRSIREGEEKI